MAAKVAMTKESIWFGKRPRLRWISGCIGEYIPFSHACFYGAERVTERPVNMVREACLARPALHPRHARTAANLQSGKSSRYCTSVENNHD
ncbi:hypothetical protein [uncultured Thiocystis sp.]|uniref:hypothetical protein n=1 Tax=uncultured Thiocystis sp. TaxID=1202134 RepID=UPI0025EB5E46|nr:hypothetical protein [uncultured Thiocystis sp.]